MNPVAIWRSIRELIELRNAVQEIEDQLSHYRRAMSSGLDPELRPRYKAEVLASIQDVMTRLYEKGLLR